MDKKDILETINHDEGMTVPKDYFKTFAKQMEEMLPEQPWEKQDGPAIIEHRTTWQKMQPYVYLAAMFAGIWCMLKMFDLASPPTIESRIESSALLAQALSDEKNREEIILEDPDIDEMYNAMYNSGVKIDDIRADLF